MNLIDTSISYPYHSEFGTCNIHSIFELVKSNVMHTAGLPSELGKVSRKAVIDGLNELGCTTATLWIENSDGSCPFGWMGVATKKDGLEYQGSIIKRILKWAWQTQQIRLPNEFTSKLGNIVGKEMSGGDSLHFEFDPIANYRAGCFGDEESCFWTDRQRARMLIRNEGGCFIKFYKSELLRDSNGVARCWIIPVGQFLDTDEQVFLLSNFYSDSSSLNQFNMTRAISDTLGFSYKRVSVQSELNVLYTNSDTGFLLSNDQSLLDNTKSLVLRYDSDYDESGEHDPLLDYADNGQYCEHCDNNVDEDDYDFDLDCCYSCRDDRYTQCDWCGGWQHNNDSIDLGHRNACCSDCAERLGYTCVECCEDWIKKDDVIVTKEGESYCQDCAESELHHCDVCGEWTSEDECCEAEEDDDGEDDICIDKVTVQPAYQEIMIGKLSDNILAVTIGVAGVERYRGWWIVVTRDFPGGFYRAQLPYYIDDYTYSFAPETFSNILTVQVPDVPRDSSYVKGDNEISTN